MLTFGSLFSGIGGFDLGFERAGMVCKWQVEIDPYCQKVLAKHWPDVERYGDVRECGAHNLQAVDVICGGFPCQPFSEAGEQRGESDDRNLWPEMRRVIVELRPRWIVAENVPGIRNIYLDTILSDLESLDYTAGTIDLPAVAFGAPHIRHRIFIVAHSTISNNRSQKYSCQIDGENTTRPTSGSCRSGNGKRAGNVAYAQEQPQRTGLRQDQQAEKWGRRFSNISSAATLSGTVAIRCNGRQNNQGEASSRGDRIEVRSWWAVEPDVGRVAYGIPNRVDRLRALGNAVVPQVAEWIGQRLVEAEDIEDGPLTLPAGAGGMEER